MFDEQWQFAVEVEREYAQYRKKVMMRYHLSAAEVDILLFLANNSQFDLATDIVRVRKMQKSHVSLAVNGLCEKRLPAKRGRYGRPEESAFEAGTGCGRVRLLRTEMSEGIWRISVLRNFRGR